ncbi:MAG TPA: hypothetical protein VI700_05815 [Thermoanaerobaculaceae bacterium]|nr:hypothetical protein [Thermoanaerobaculaceae bacterium]
MSSIREQIVVAAIAALNSGRPATVPAIERFRGLDVEPSQLPSGTLVEGKEHIQRSKNKFSPLVDRAFRFALKWRAARPAGDASAGPGTAIDPMLNWATATLPRNTFGGLALDVEEVSILWTPQQGEKFFMLAVQEFELTYTTRVNDAEQRV